MKKLAFFSFATLAVLLSSCADLASVENTESETNTIAAVMEGVQTKTSTTDEGHFSWSEGDNIWLETTADYVLGTLSAGAGTPNATFNYGSFFGDLTGKSVYPYNEGHSVEGDVLNVVLPASYDLGSNLNNTNSPMYGVNLGGTLKFNHLAGVMSFSFKNVPAGVDRFVFTVDKKINGTFAADLTADYPVLQTEAAQADAERTVTFNFDALANTSDVKIFVPLPLGTYESLELALYKGEESVWTYSKAVTNTINRKSLKLMPTVSMGGSIGGDIEGEELYISIAANSANVACDVTWNNDLCVNSNAEELAFEALTDSPWISIALFKGNTDDNWIVEASMTENTTTENRTAQFKVYIKDNSEKYVVIEYTQEASTTFFADYVDEFGVNHSKGTLIDGVIWAPVNCGYHAEDYTYGKLYQWGRKYGQGYDESYTGLYDATYPTKDNGQLIEGTVTIAEGLSEANKDNFYYAPSGSYYKDWWNEGTTYAKYANLWNAGTATEPVKSDSDPCPEGWRVPTLSEAQNLLKNYSSWVQYNGQNGYWFSGSKTYSENSPKVFLPATGERTGGAGAYAYNRRYIGCYWTSDRSGYFYFEDGRVVFSTNTVYSYNGDAVRCVQE